MDTSRPKITPKQELAMRTAAGEGGKAFASSTLNSDDHHAALDNAE